MAITNTQFGVITEAEFAKLAILTSNGALVPARPLADDERRDFEIHIRRGFRKSLAAQVKATRRLHQHGRVQVLQINFRSKPPLVSNPWLWYFMGRFDVDVKAMRYTDPIIFAPSDFVHRHALHGVGRGMIQLQIKASMDPASKDMWSPYRHPQAELGSRILEAMEGLQERGLGPQAAHLLSLTGVVLLNQPGATATARRTGAA